MKLRSITPDSSPHLTACLILCILLHPSHRPALLCTSSLSADYFLHFKSLLSHLLYVYLTPACCLSDTMFIFPAPSSSCLVAFLIYSYYFFASVAGKQTSDMEPLANISAAFIKKRSTLICLLKQHYLFIFTAVQKVCSLFMFSRYYKGFFFYFVNWKQAVCSFNHLPFKHHRTNNSKFPCMIKKFCESTHNSNF